MVNTITGKLREDRSAPALVDRVGGSTYTLDIWPGHRLAEEVYGTLGRLRASMVDLRERVERANAEDGLPADFTRVIAYVGQCVIGENDNDPDETA
jgi:hypothetical protein